MATAKTFNVKLGRYTVPFIHHSDWDVVRIRFLDVLITRFTTVDNGFIFVQSPFLSAIVV